MSYNSDKIRMNRQINEKKNRLIFIIKITFIALFISLIVLVAVLCVSMMFDEEAPIIKPAISGDVIGYVGDAPTYKKYVIVTDNKDSDPLLEVDASAVNASKPGTYTVRYRATDSAGNQTYYSLTYIVKSKAYSKDKLNSKIASFANSLGITKNMSKEEQIKRIYGFVNDVIGFNDKSNIVKINRDNWKQDWIEEAILTLEGYEEGDCKGDCYSYYSVSKAFFEYFGIKNIGLRRDKSLDKNHGTHFWHIVDVGNGKWYYYDATNLKGKFSDGTRNACLIPQAKLDSYEVTENNKYNFYQISKTEECVDYSSAGRTDYPTIATK